MIGLPESDFDRMLKLTQELFGNDDEELGRAIAPRNSTPSSWTSSILHPMPPTAGESHRGPGLGDRQRQAGGEYLNDVDCLSTT
jgi:hypothetical protein